MDRFFSRFHIASAIAVVCAFTMTCLSCGKDGGEDDGPSGGPALSVSPLTLEFTSDAGTGTLDIAAASAPKFVSSDTWCKASATSVKEGRYSGTVTVQANTSTSSRTATISVVCGDEKVKVTVNQAGAEPEPTPGPDDFLTEPERGDNNAWKTAALFGFGWNLGNHMDAQVNGIANETCWGNPKATQATFDGLKAKGITSVRIPVTWLGHVGEAPGYKIDETWMNRVAEIVGYAEKAGLNAIVNIHHDGSGTSFWLNVKKAASSEAEYKAVEDRFKAMWKQIAEKFADKGEWLAFEAFNELQDGNWGWGDNLTDNGAQYNVVNKLNRAFVETVRAAGGYNATRYLGIPGYCTNPDLTIANLVLPEDSAKDRLMVSVHFYDPSDYTLENKYSEWGHTGKAGVTPSSGEKEVIAVFRKLKEKYIDNGIPVYLGETGCSNRDTDRATLFQKYYFEFVYKAARSYGLAPFLWDNGAKGSGRETHGFIDHGTGEYISSGKTMIETMHKALFTESSSYTLKSVYDGAPR